ncbi:MAG TPA: hypothetical protein VHO47_03345 [Candidatus Babeliales bacterium]|nr:hypothetical protein [Candidatus Babeliales bacterium]
MYRILLAALLLSTIQLHADTIELTNIRETPHSDTARNTLRLLDLLYKYESLLKDLRIVERAASLGRIVSAGYALAYAPFYSYKAIDYFSDYRHSSAEKITSVLYFSTYAALISYLAYAVDAFAKDRLALEKKTLMPKLTALQLMLQEEFKDENSEDAKTLLNDIKRTIAQLR